MILVFLIFSFKPALSLSFTLIKRLFSCCSLSAIRVVSSIYLRLLMFLLPILIPACNSLIMMCSAAAAKSLQSCPTLCNPIDGSSPGSPVPGILQARVLEWVAIAFSEFITSDQIRSVAQSCPTFCDPMNRSTPGLPVHHQLPEFTETQAHRVSDAIQPSHPLSSPSPLAPNPSQHQSLFQ